MPETIQDRVAEVARRARLLLLCFGIALTLATVIGTGVVLGTVDYLLRIRGSGVRIILTALWLGICGWAVHRFFWPAFTARWSDVAVARLIERRFPQLRDRLSSAIAFLAEPDGDGTGGSVALRRSHVRDTAAAINALDLTEATNQQPVRLAMATVGCVVVVLAMAAASAPAATWQAAMRLMWPLGDHPWPAVHHLEFTQRPTRIAIGDRFEVALIDSGGTLPDTVSVYYWLDGESENQAQAFPMHRQGDTMVHHRDNVTKPFKYRAVGGDHRSMPWIVVSVVETPQIVESSFRLTPPDYTGWLPQDFKGPSGLQVLEGTRIEIVGRVNKPLASAALNLHQDGLAPELISGVVDPDGYRFRIPGDAANGWVAQRSGEYWLQWTDISGFQAVPDGRWWQRVVADGPPSVSLYEPEDNAVATTQARILLRSTTKDDLAIRRIQLHFSRSDKDHISQLVTLHEGSAQISPMQVSTLSEAVALAETRDVVHEWDLSSLQLSPGAVVSYFLTATDYKLQTSDTEVRRLTIVTNDELQARIDRRRSLLLARLSSILQQQRQVLAQVTDVELRLQETRTVGNRAADRLHAAELSQRRVFDALVGDGDSILEEMHTLQRQIERNRLRGGDVYLGLLKTVRTIQQLRDQHLNIIGQTLTTGRKAMQSTTQPAHEVTNLLDSVVGPSLARARTHQQAVVDSLEQLLQVRSKLDSYRRLEREVASVRKEQAEITEVTATTGRRTITREFASLPADYRLKLEQIARRQSELATKLDRVLDGLSQSSRDLAESDPRAATVAGESLQSARQAAISGRMRDVARQIVRNRIGLAARRQQEIDDALGNVLVRLHGRQRQPIEEQMVRLERLISELKDRQESILAETVRLDGRDQAGQTDRRVNIVIVSARQRDLAKDAAALADEMPQLMTFQYVMGLAVRSMQKANDHLDRFDTGPNTQTHENAALKRLEIIAHSWQIERLDPQQTPREEESSLTGESGHARQVLRQGLAELTLLKTMQEAINHRTTELERLRQQHGRLAIDQVLELEAMAVQQGRLAEIVGDLSRTTSRMVEQPAKNSPVGSQMDDADPLDELDSELNEILTK